MARLNKHLSSFKHLSAWGISSLLCCCIGETTHLEFAPIASEGWAYTDTLCYTMTPATEAGERGVSVLLRTDNYIYQNLALHVTIAQDTLLHDMRHTYKLDECSPSRGIGLRCDYTLPIGNIVFNDSTLIIIALQHRMDTTTLPGIHAVGIHCRPHIPEPGEVIWQVKW